LAQGSESAITVNVVSGLHRDAFVVLGEAAVIRCPRAPFL